MLTGTQPLNYKVRFLVAGSFLGDHLFQDFAEEHRL